MIDLRNVVEKYPECLENPTKFKNYLIDLYPSQEDQVQIRILSDIMRCGIVEEIKAGKTDSVAITHYRTVIASKYGYSSQLVLECISKWVSAFDPNVSYNSEYINENRTTENSIGDNDVVDLNLTPVEDTPVPTTNRKPNHHRQHGKMAKWIVAVLCLLCLVIIGVLTYNNQIIPEKQYNTAVEQLEQGNYQQAIDEFEALNDYKDSADMILETKYKWAESLLADKAYDEAYAKFEEVKGYSDAADKMKDVRYAEAEEYLDKNGYQMAINLLGTLDGYKDSQVKVQEANYLWAEDYLQQGQFEEALTHFEKAGLYKDAEARVNEVYEMMQVHATAVKLNKTSLTISKGKTAELSATLEPSDTTDTIVSWTSSNEKVATVDENGVVTAVSAGNAVIKIATSNGLNATCKVTVSESAKVPSAVKEPNAGNAEEARANTELTEDSLQGRWVSTTVPGHVYEMFEFNGSNLRYEIYYGGNFEYVKVYTGTFKLIDAKYTDKALYFKETKQESFWPDGKYELYEIPDGFSGEWSPRPITEFTGTSFTTSNVLKYIKTTNRPESPIKEWGFN